MPTYGDKQFEIALSHMGLTPRPQQTKLIDIARRVANNGSTEFVQAGTGTGKSFVLLSAALEAARRHPERKPSVVVCPTNNLIDQYVHQDAPRVSEATGGKFKYLKGRNRYLCTSSFMMSQEPDPIATFDKLTKDGLIEWADHGLDNSWGCSGDCDPQLGDRCAVQIARSEAATAEVIITNGHLLVWNWRVLGFTDGQIGLLPDFGSLFVDEAHALDDVGRSCMSDRITQNSPVYREVPGLSGWVDGQTKDLSESNREMAFDHTDPALVKMAEESSQTIADLMVSLDNAIEMKDIGVARMLKKQIRAHERFVDFAAAEEDDRFISTITLDYSDPNDDPAPILNSICVDSSFIFREVLAEQPSLLVSGTVPPTLPRRMGVADAPLEDVGTPFDYSRSVLAISSYRGNDRNQNWNRIKEMAAAVNDMSGRSHVNGGGGTLILFTSWSDLKEFMPKIAKLMKHKVPVFMQSSDPKDTAECLRQFKEHGHAVMGGVTSMWTGVDVPGPALRQVIIARLPWGVPTLEVKAVEKIHGRQVYVDSMMQLLAQGMGRLVRTTDDNGRVYIADARANTLRFSASPLTRHINKFSRYNRPT